jgi:NAD+--asparagine ADP-ribosyltransferase
MNVGFIIILHLLASNGYAVMKPNFIKINQRAGSKRFVDNNGRFIRNYRYAGRSVMPFKISNKLSIKFNKPIKFNRFGYPDFTKYSIKTIKTTRLTGNHQQDVRLVERILKQKNPQWKKRVGYTWHHHQDMKTMQYVPTKLHSAIPHSGGASRLRIKKGGN